MNTNVLKSGFRPVLALAAVAALAAGVTTVGRAGEIGGGADLPTAMVPISDLDLGTNAGAEHLFGRLQHAAEQVCDDNPGVRYTLSEEVAMHSCESNAIAPPVRQLHVPLLTVLYNRHYHNSAGAVVVEPVQG